MSKFSMGMSTFVRRCVCERRMCFVCLVGGCIILCVGSTVWPPAVSKMLRCRRNQKSSYETKKLRDLHIEMFMHECQHLSFKRTKGLYYNSLLSPCLIRCNVLYCYAFISSRLRFTYLLVSYWPDIWNISSFYHRERIRTPGKSVEPLRFELCI